MIDLETPVTELLSGNHGKARLLVVDDQPINIQVMYQAFGSDYQVFMATSGEQALTICNNNPPDLILLDIVMPGMDGFEVCKRLKSDEATSHIPIIFVTAHTDAAQETRGLSLGAVDFIAKPVSPPIVLARVRTHLALKATADFRFSRHGDWWLPPWRWFGHWVVFSAEVRQAFMGVERRVWGRGEVIDFDNTGDSRMTPLRSAGEANPEVA
jgi:CheY-like chemotaxis protein